MTEIPTPDVASLHGNPAAMHMFLAELNRKLSEIGEFSDSVPALTAALAARIGVLEQSVSELQIIDTTVPSLAALIRYSPASGTSPQAIGTSFTWTKVTLNASAEYDDGTALESISSSTISLKPGTYRLISFFNASKIGTAQGRFVNTDDDETLTTCNATEASTTNDACASFRLFADRVELASEKSIEVQIRSSATTGTIGVAATSGSNEGYVDVEIYRYPD